MFEALNVIEYSRALAWSRVRYVLVVVRSVFSAEKKPSIAADETLPARFILPVMPWSARSRFKDPLVYWRGSSEWRMGEAGLVRISIWSEVTLQTHGKDKYKRTLSDVLLSDGTNANHELVKEGRCWWYNNRAVIYESDVRLLTHTLKRS